MFDFLKKLTGSNNNKTVSEKASLYADSSSISPDERSYYKPDDYYTLYSHPGTSMQTKVVTFEERKKTSYPSKRGLYVAEIMLLDYCNKGNYPKPNSGYPGLWWFKYGIRDVGHALESLEKRGFLQWASKTQSLRSLKVGELKQILTSKGLSVSGKKAELISRIIAEIPEADLIIPNYSPKYELTAMGLQELEENGYIPYLSKHSRLTTEDDTFGETFNVWDINKLFPNGDASNWRQIVGEIEERRYGVNIANASKDEVPLDENGEPDYLSMRDEMRAFLKDKQIEIQNGINTPGDGFDEEMQGLDYKSIGKDKDALVKLFISIGKKFDAPALYRETAVLLRKYGMYAEEMNVINAGLRNVPFNNRQTNELADRKKELEVLLQIKQDQ